MSNFLLDTERPWVLDTLNISFHCPASWDAMEGDETVRFCAECRQNVYNLEQMTRVEAETLIVEKEGRLCLRYYRRADGRIVTRDCQATISKWKPYWLALLFAFIGMVFFLIWQILGAETTFGQRHFLREVEPFRTVMEWIDPSPPPPIFMGK